MGITEIVAIIIPIFGGLSFMAYNHHDWFMPFSEAILHVLLASWGLAAGFTLAISVILRKIPESSPKIINGIKAIDNIVDGIPIMLWLLLIGVFTLRQISDYIQRQKKYENYR